jgi:hypothetical protein
MIPQKCDVGRHLFWAWVYEYSLATNKHSGKYGNWSGYNAALRSYRLHNAKCPQCHARTLALTAAGRAVPHEREAAHA